MSLSFYCQVTFTENKNWLAYKWFVLRCWIVRTLIFRGSEFIRSQDVAFFVVPARKNVNSLRDLRIDPLLENVQVRA